MLYFLLFHDKGRLNVTLHVHYILFLHTHLNCRTIQSILTRPNEILKARVHNYFNWMDEGQHKGGNKSATVTDLKSPDVSQGTGRPTRRTLKQKTYYKFPHTIKHDGATTPNSDMCDFRSPQRSCWALRSSGKLHCRELPPARRKYPQRWEPATPETLCISSYLSVLLGMAWGRYLSVINNGTPEKIS
jgi:hypothetical protein